MAILRTDIVPNECRYGYRIPTTGVVTSKKNLSTDRESGMSLYLLVLIYKLIILFVLATI